ncbi:MAG TPA: hypothetical protein PKA00_23420 [Saprospiraceae bacterium]|nr:hypothetical protein [Saprospiraceae bacterium]HMQ85879.1 hypothetical protein [Saprospiraceae bacterium]
MKKHIRIFLGCFYVLMTATVSAQGPIGGFMPGRGVTVIAPAYSIEHFSEYLFGAEKMATPLTTKSYSLYVEHGFSDTFALLVNVPYLKIDEVNRGLQDGGIFIKYRNQYQQYLTGNFSAITAIGLSFPLSAYPTNTDNPIGAGAVSFQGRFLMQYNFKSGAFLHAQSGLEFRLLQAIQVSMPVLFRFGYGTKWYFAEGWAEWYNTFGNGIDSNTSGGAGSDWLRVGATLYFPVVKDFGVFIGGAKVLTGRNIGLSNRLNLGVVYRL